MTNRKTDTPAHFEVIEGRKGWRWRLRDGNGEIVAHGEHYTRKSDCLRGIENLRSTVDEATRIEAVDARTSTKKKARAR